MAMSAKASDDIAWLPATAQLAVLAAKKVSSAELVELYLSRIDTYNASLNAIVTVDPDAARRVAKRSDAARARGDELGPLHGLPITVKDSYETAGMRTTCGRRDLADYVPTQDAEAVARLRRAGAIIMGKTNMPTGNQDVQASNPVFGRTNNPWDAARTSGGSAGGGAAATAAGLTSFDYGSEIGGSTRIPAHYCGLYGHKSTWRSVPLVGHIPSAPGNPGRWGQADMACAGVQVRGARDIIPALEATVGPMRADGGFSYALAPPRAGALKDFRVAVWAEDPHCPIDADVRRAMDDAVAALRAAGAHVVEQPATIPVDMAVSHNIFQSLVFGAFAVDRSTLSPASAAALGLRAVRHPRGEAANALADRRDRRAERRCEQRRRIPGVGVAVGKDAAVGEQASRDSGPLIVSRPLAIDPPRQQLKADDAGVVEGNDDGLRYPLGVPEGFDEIRALEGRVRVIPGFVGVAVADVVQVDAGEVESRAQESFHLRPTVGTIRPARQERSRDPRPSSAPYERAQRRTWVDARPLSVVAHPLPSGEPLLCADERARPVRHRALASRWRRLSRSMSVHLRNQSTPISLRVALTDVQCRL